MKMRAFALCLLALSLLAGCHQRKTAPARAELTPKARNQAIVEQAAELEAPVKAKVLDVDPRGCTWIQSEGAVAAGEDETPQQLRASAVDAARRTAMQDFLGVAVKSRNMDFQQEGLRDQTQIVESMLLTTRQGRILDEKLIRDGYQDLAGCARCRYGVTLRACILPNPDYADKDFMIDLGLSRNRLVAGDEVTLNVTATRECWVYLYDLWLDWGKTSLIAPNDRVPEIHLKAGQTWEYPDDNARKAGVSKLVAELPEGYKVSAETVRVIASRTPLPSKITDPAEGFLAVLRRMNAARVDWAEDAQAFTIYKK